MASKYKHKYVWSRLGIYRHSTINEIHSSLQHELFNGMQYWNSNASIIATHIPTNEKVAAIGTFGHQVNWYIQAEVVKGNNLSPKELATFTTIISFKRDPKKIPSNYTIVYNDNYLQIAKSSAPNLQ